ncbi:phosphonate C-P lyase system protein PhnG [Paracidovorax anthurii]|uniref:Alpha-D-ribose 1-methylphosphonate 5-triphosphate synthase subunit PhnG n=1 Tax=Paracidovorax anthurii TaxID=78229 RepID=A0A328ZLE9_9BURK|nr:phosphonate C-P lyase system protein PhnG [Paracidovorax anthurii]RAR85482.1 alpha-D-ribose 1-methylphosphonate 5-triphosphate synthase subunit PhnG [Paracidovorax anthurii]WCM91484.1 phosphonate C-P lyase system protein PhnG [Acidovorax sp. NCPPB 2350]
MFHAFDNLPPGRSATRAEWMALLARAPADLLAGALGDRAREEPRWLRPPETGLMMVQGRIGGTGARFNVGEVTVTRCALRRPGAAPVGVAYVLGRSHRQARLAALADALLQEPGEHAALEAALLQPARRHIAAQRAQQQASAQSTRVDFFTMARESAGGEEDEA